MQEEEEVIGVGVIHRDLKEVRVGMGLNGIGIEGGRIEQEKKKVGKVGEELVVLLGSDLISLLRWEREEEEGDN